MTLSDPVQPVGEVMTLPDPDLVWPVGRVTTLSDPMGPARGVMIQCGQ